MGSVLAPIRTLRPLLWAWSVSVVLLLAAYVAHLTVGWGGTGLDAFFNDWVQCGLLLHGCAVCVIGGRRQERSGPWLILAAGLGSWALANIIWSAWVGRLPEPPYPSASDALWLAYYPAAYVSLVLLVRDRVERFRASVWLDGLIGALGSAALAATLMWPALDASGDVSSATVIVNLAYPVADVLLLAVLAASLSLTGARLDRGLALIVVGLLINMLADGSYLLLLAGGWEEGPSLLDPLWIVAQLLTALAASQRVPVQPRRLEGWRLVMMPVGFASVAVGLLAWGAVQTLPAVPCVFAVGTIVAAATRAALTYRENAQLIDARREARTDELTGLANRRELYSRLDHLLAQDEPTLAILLLDLDGFKELNDALGHQAGDELLKRMAERLERTVQRADLLVRLGGDEFVVLIASGSRDDAVAAARAVRDALVVAFRIDETDVNVQASIGIALAPEHGRSRTELLKHADIAMYRAKRDGTGIEVHDDESWLPDRDHLQLASDLHGAIPAGQLAVFFQAKADLGTGQISGAEALVRWMHPVRGLLGPDMFLSLAQRHGLMRELTAAVLDEALARQATWRAAGLQIPVAVNLARANLIDIGFPDEVADALRRHGATPDDLHLEVTEDTVMIEADRAMAGLAGLRRVGVKLALDDFGTGHSSFAYLKQLPVDELKIDRSFVIGMGVDDRDEAIVEAATGLGLRFGLRVVAEGVEHAAAWNRLSDLGCHEAQGWFIAKPLPAAEFLAFALDRSPVPVA